jgi:hypothetical protein
MDIKRGHYVAVTPDHLEYLKSLYYQEKQSIPEISKITGYSIASLYSFMDRHGLARRSNSEQDQIRFDRKPPSFSLKENLDPLEEVLKAMGSMSYWAEGGKSGIAYVDFANSDPAMITLFLNFLRVICGVNEKKLRVLLYCYANQNLPALISFWSTLTKIPTSQFTKPYVRHDFDPKKIGKMAHGLIHIRYCDKKLLLLLKSWIEGYAQKFAQVVP